MIDDYPAIEAYNGGTKHGEYKLRFEVRMSLAAGFVTDLKQVLAT